MSYENAPATKMLATHCAICGRPLVDAVSVECGIGPDCRENSGYNIEAEPGARETANGIVYRIAAGMPLAEVITACEALAGFGFSKLASTILNKKAAIVVEDWGDGTLAVFTPYDAGFVSKLKAATPWRKWDGAQKCWLVPGGAEVVKKLWAAMTWCFPGVIAVGPKGAKMTPGQEW